MCLHRQTGQGARSALCVLPPNRNRTHQTQKLRVLRAHICKPPIAFIVHLYAIPMPYTKSLLLFVNALCGSRSVCISTTRCVSRISCTHSHRSPSSSVYIISHLHTSHAPSINRSSICPQCARSQGGICNRDATMKTATFRYVCSTIDETYSITLLTQMAVGRYGSLIHSDYKKHRRRIS